MIYDWLMFLYLRSSKKGRKGPRHEGSEDNIRERRLRATRKSAVIETSNDESDAQASASSGHTSDVSDEPGPKKRISSLRKSRWKGRSKKRKAHDKFDIEKEDNGIQTRLNRRYKDDAQSKIQENVAEHQIQTRRSASVSDQITSPKLMDSSLKKDGHILEFSTLEGGGMKMLGRKTQKDFGGKLYNGEVVDYDNRVKYYKVSYFLKGKKKCRNTCQVFL